MKKFVALRPKTHNYFTDNECVDKKSKVTKNLLWDKKSKVEDYKKCLEKNEETMTRLKKR